MKTLFGFIQFGLGISGLIALFSGQWLILILCWAGAFLVGFLGGRAVRVVEGVSQGGQEVLGNMSHAIEALHQGRYDSANGLMMGAVSQFKLGGDKGLLVMALALQSVTMSAVRKTDGARKSIAEARERFDTFERESNLSLAEIRELKEQTQGILSLVELGISRGSSPDSLVSEFLDFVEQS